MYDVQMAEQNHMSLILGRNKVHDERSRAFPMATTINRSLWTDKAVRLYEPWPNPHQLVGCCTGVAKASQLNAVGNRVPGRVLKLADAERMYSRNSQIDPWEGSWPPEDTGSSGLASAKTAIEFGLAGEYRWLFGGADEVVQNVMEGRAISVGTWWFWSMFKRDSQNRVAISEQDGTAGGHQYVIRGYDLSSDLVLGRCWWGNFRDFWMSRADLDRLLRDGGDAHFQRSV
jgi:hypothetical protein